MNGVNVAAQECCEARHIWVQCCTKSRARPRAYQSQELSNNKFQKITLLCAGHPLLSMTSAPAAPTKFPQVRRQVFAPSAFLPSFFAMNVLGTALQSLLTGKVLPWTSTSGTNCENQQGARRTEEMLCTEPRSLTIAVSAGKQVLTANGVLRVTRVTLIGGVAGNVTNMAATTSQLISQQPPMEKFSPGRPGLSSETKQKQLRVHTFVAQFWAIRCKHERLTNGDIMAPDIEKTNKPVHFLGCRSPELRYSFPFSHSRGLEGCGRGETEPLSIVLLSAVKNGGKQTR